MELQDQNLTTLLRRAQSGDLLAQEQVLPLLYPRLRSIARRLLRQEGPDHTLQPTELAHEVWMELLGDAGSEYADRSHFFATVATAMRNLLTDHARRKLAMRHGGSFVRVVLRSDAPEMAEDRDMLRSVLVDDLLVRLADSEAELVRLIELRFFLGLTIDETAAALSVTEATVRRRWKRARQILAGLIGAPK